MDVVYLFAMLLISMAIILGFFNLIGLHSIGVVIWLFVAWAIFSAMGEVSSKNSPRK